jgi:hypothetical protein
LPNDVEARSADTRTLVAPLHFGGVRHRTSRSVFTAGMSAMTDPQWWIYHQEWVGIFQWLVLPLPPLAWLCGEPRLRRTLFAFIPTLQIALQYVFAHRAIEGTLPIGIGLHAVNAALMPVVVVILLTGWGDS